MKITTSLLIFCACCLYSAPCFAAQPARPLALAADGSAALTSVSGDFGLMYVDTATSAPRELMSSDFGAYFTSISDDGRRAAFKDFHDTPGEGRMQTPTVYLSDTNTIVHLCEPQTQAGNPALGPNNLVTYADGNVLRVATLNDAGGLTQILKQPLDFVANTCEFTPDGASVLFTSPDGDVLRLDIADTTVRTVAQLEGCFAPRVNPDGTRVAVTTHDGKIGVAPLNTGKATVTAMRVIAAPESGRPDPTWVDADTLAYTEADVTGDQVTTTRRVAMRVDTPNTTTATLTSVAGESTLINAGKTVLTTQDLPATPTKAQTPRPLNSLITSGNSVMFDGYMPYLNQVYDVLNTFAGGYSCCNAASALIAIQYYNRLKPMPRTVTTGGTHTSNWGFYVSEPYTYNGKTFNIKSSTAWGSDLAGYSGGFGYFLQDGSSGTSLQRSTRLKEYIAYHNITSAVDNSPTIAKIRTEVDNEYPTVLLVSITAAGHYITSIGYVKNQSTLIFFDPYGNKNVAYPSKDGTYAYYDWPGYNNGYQNLVTVHRYIYARAANPTTLNITAPTSYANRGGTLQMTCIADMNKGGTKDLTNEVTWSASSSGAIATISSTGLLSISSAASTTKNVYVTATFQNLTKLFTVTVPLADVDDWKQYE